MKKSLLLLLAAIMVLSLVACSEGAKDPSDSSNSDDPPPSGEEYDPHDPEQYIYRQIFADSPHKEQWQTDAYGADLYGIWDQSVLPSVFPEQPDSVTAIDRTGYVGKKDQKLGGSALGKLWFDHEKQDHEYFYVMFDGTEQTYDTLTADLSGKFPCYNDAEDSFTGSRSGYYHAYSTDWYLFMSYTEDGEYNWDTSAFTPSGLWRYTLYAVPVYHALPKIVQGIALPQFGYLMSQENVLMCYEEGDDEYTYLDYDYQTGTASGTVKTNWANEEMEYYGASMSEIQAYCDALIADGFTASNQDPSGETFYMRYKKDGVDVNIRYHEEFRYMYLWIVCGEYWYY